jgi:hypothetical protein
MILRSLIETLNIFTVTLYNPELRTLYQQAQDFPDANMLWKSNFNDRNIYKKLHEIMTSSGADEETLTFFLDWQKEEKQFLNQYVHSSYIASALSSEAPSFTKNSFPTAIFGAPTVFSLRKIDVCFKSIWFFSLLGFKQLVKPVDKSIPLISIDQNDNWFKINKSTWYVFNHVVMKYWDADINIQSV